MITTKAKKIGLSSAVIFFVMLGSLVFTWIYITQAGTDLLNQTQEVADYNARIKTYIELSQLIDSTQVQREELASYVLTENRIIDFLAEIEQIALEQGVEMVTDSLNEVEQEGLFNTLVVSLSVTGSKENIKNLLFIFETLPYHGSLSKVSLIKESKGNVIQTTGVVELNISLLKV